MARGGVFVCSRKFSPRPRTSGLLTVGLLALVLLDLGCTIGDFRVEDLRTTPEGIVTDEAVAVVLSRFPDKFSLEKENEIVECVGNSIQKAHPTVRVLRPDQFRRVAFPNLPSEEVPPQPWEHLLEEPAFRERIAPLGLRYLIVVSGETKEDWWLEPTLSALFYAGERTSRLAALILDAKGGGQVGRALGHASGRSGWVILPIPFYFAAPTETRACGKIGEGVAKFLAGESPGSSRETSQMGPLVGKTASRQEAVGKTANMGETEEPLLKLFSEVVVLIQSQYVDEVNAQDLSAGAIRGMLETVTHEDRLLAPEVLDAAKKAAKAEEANKPVKVFSEAFRLVQSPHGDKVSPKDLVYGGIRGMLEMLDPHSSFMPPELYREMQVETQGSFAALGVEITVRDRQLTVVAPIEGGPADRAGIQPGDKIIRIDGQPTKDMTLIEAVRKLRGPKTQVTVTIIREGQEAYDLTATREIVEVHSVRASDLGEGIVYIRLVSFFKERTSQDVEKALNELKQKGMRALILDLRNNPGGPLVQVVKVADIFLDKGKSIVITEGRTKSQNLHFVDQHDNPHDFPMVVLVNRGTASGSEIVAGALQDHKRAILLGTQTAGQGTIQTVIPLNDGSGLRLTTAKFLTPKRHSIHGTGITPDIVVEEPKPEPVARTAPAHLKSDVQLQRAVEILKRGF
jgi:carboxyl-terminal processing protease